MYVNKLKDDWVNDFCQVSLNQLINDWVFVLSLFNIHKDCAIKYYNNENIKFEKCI